MFSLLLIYVYLLPNVVAFPLIIKDIKLIDEKYDSAAGYLSRRLKITLFVLALAVVPAALLISELILPLTAQNTDTYLAINIGFVAVILLCALTEAILLNRGRESHRVLPWVLAAINLAATLLIWFGAGAIFSWLAPALTDWLFDYYYTPPFNSFSPIRDAFIIAAAIALLQLVLLAKQLLFRLCYRASARIVPFHLLMIGANLLAVGLALILPHAIADGKTYEIVSYVLVAVLNVGAIVSALLLGMLKGNRINFKS